MAMDPNTTSVASLVHVYAYFLKTCTQRKALSLVRRVQSHLVHLVQQGPGAAVTYLGEHVVSALIKCGGLEDALPLFQVLPQRTAVSWGAIISGYACCGKGREALRMYALMVREGVQPSAHIFVTLLTACGSIPDLDQGRRIHAHAVTAGCASQLFVGTCLVAMYAKCGSLGEAQQVFHALPHRDVVVWNALLAAYAHHGRAEEAWQLYQRLLEDGPSPDDRTFVSVLQVCGLLADLEQEACVVGGHALKPNSLHKARVLHSHYHSRMKHWPSALFVGNATVTMYAKCGSILDAQHVFETLPERDVVSWNGLLAAHVQLGQAQTALRLLCTGMLEECVHPDERTLVIILQACGMLADEEPGSAAVNGGGQSVKALALTWTKVVHAEACKQGCLSDSFVASALVTSYGKCGSIPDAQIVFAGCSHQCGLVSWNAMLAAYSQQGYADEVLHLYSQLVDEDMSLDVRTFSVALQACGMLADKQDIQDDGQDTIRAACLWKGKAIHAAAWRCGYELHVYVASALVSMYGSCGSIQDAHNVFDRVPEPDLVVWNAIIAAYAQLGPGRKAVQLYTEMQEKGWSPDARTFVSVLQACSRLVDKDLETCEDETWAKGTCLQMGMEIHAYAWSKGYRCDIYIGNALINLYGKWGSIDDAHNVFDSLPERDVVAWNAILSTHARQGQPEEVLELYETMQEQGMNADSRTFVILLQACGLLAEIEGAAGCDPHLVKPVSLSRGKALHMEALRRGCASDVFVGSTLISLYGKCGSLVDAQLVFNGLPHHTVVSWTAILSACVALEQGDKALQMYRIMQEEGVHPNEVTLICILQACSITGSLDICRQVHEDLVTLNGTNLSSMLAITLIQAYGRCASMADAQDVFNELPRPNVVAWNALLGGYAQQGNSAACLEWYEKMQQAGVTPSGVTFLSVLSACNHAGLVDQGVKYFESASRQFGLCLEIEHYVCVIDLLGRAGWFKMVEDLIVAMPVQPNLSIWLCLLGACRKHSMVVLGRRAFEQAVTLDPKHAAAYILMSNIYADAGLSHHEHEVKELGRKAGVWTTNGLTNLDEACPIKNCERL